MTPGGTGTPEPPHISDQCWAFYCFLARNLGAYSFVGKRDIGAGVNAYMFEHLSVDRKDSIGSRATVPWSDRHDRYRITLESDRVQVLEWGGREVLIEIGERKVTLDLGPRPVFLVEL